MNTIYELDVFYLLFLLKKRGVAFLVVLSFFFITCFVFIYKKNPTYDTRQYVYSTVLYPNDCIEYVQYLNDQLTNQNYAYLSSLTGIDEESIQIINRISLSKTGERNVEIMELTSNVDRPEEINLVQLIERYLYSHPYIADRDSIYRANEIYAKQTIQSVVDSLFTHSENPKSILSADFSGLLLAKRNWEFTATTHTVFASLNEETVEESKLSIPFAIIISLLIGLIVASCSIWGYELLLFTRRKINQYNG